VIGAMTRHVDVATSSIVRDAIPALAALAGGIGDPAVRNRGTIGGSIANNDPAADYPAACLALGATIVTNQRSLPAADFFTGLFETALEDGEIVTEVLFPKPAKSAWQKFRNPASRYAIVGVFVAQIGGEVRVAVTGAGSSGVFRVPQFEAALARDFSAKALEGITVDPSGLNADIHADAAYRAHLINVLARRAVAAAK
jgi:carbon-monoxide dehydrogenase medium subunit